MFKLIPLFISQYLERSLTYGKLPGKRRSRFFVYPVSILEILLEILPSYKDIISLQLTAL